MLNNLMEGHTIFADLVTTIGFLYRFTRGVLSKIWLSSLNYRLDTGMLIEIYIKESHIKNYLTLNSRGGDNLSSSKI